MSPTPAPFPHDAERHGRHEVECTAIDFDLARRELTAELDALAATLGISNLLNGVFRDPAHTPGQRQLHLQHDLANLPVHRPTRRERIAGWVRWH